MNKLVLAGDPRRFGCALRGDLSGLWRYRVGDYRLIVKLEDTILTVDRLARSTAPDALAFGFSADRN